MSWKNVAAGALGALLLYLVLVHGSHWLFVELNG